ncbi:hypothetical protein F8M41_022438 [Gigaspora margarita]|uniref:Uncharacterized protein n=1 Tax=Gigaspora margarita TaxID=4874 RepID=A0A8H4EHZ7_GIGMA|nr:hypothetical protein F8M41_022438 [Gigaspora margarita]
MHNLSAVHITGCGFELSDCHVFDIAFDTISNLLDVGVIKMSKEKPLTSKQIKYNIDKLKGKLANGKSKLYQRLFAILNGMSTSELTWEDPLGSQKPAEDMVPATTPSFLQEECIQFISNFSTQNERSSERQSVASADRRGDEKTGRRPDIMFVCMEDGKFYELMYTECSKITCTKRKEKDDDVKLWRESNDGMYWAHKSRRLEKEQFGIIGMQVAGRKLLLNVLIRNEVEVHRYYNLRESVIPIQYSNNPYDLAEFVNTLLIFRNILIVNMSLLRSAQLRRSKRNLDSSTVTTDSE